LVIVEPPSAPAKKEIVTVPAVVLTTARFDGPAVGTVVIAEIHAEPFHLCNACVSVMNAN
jgi:hypothetical protein